MGEGRGVGRWLSFWLGWVLGELLGCCGWGGFFELEGGVCLFFILNFWGGGLGWVGLGVVGGVGGGG